MQLFCLAFFWVDRGVCIYVAGFYAWLEVRARPGNLGTSGKRARVTRAPQEKHKCQALFLHYFMECAICLLRCAAERSVTLTVFASVGEQEVQSVAGRSVS